MRSRAVSIVAITLAAVVLSALGPPPGNITNACTPPLSPVPIVPTADVVAFLKKGHLRIARWTDDGIPVIDGAEPPQGNPGAVNYWIKHWGEGGSGGLKIEEIWVLAPLYGALVVVRNAEGRAVFVASPPGAETANPSLNGVVRGILGTTGP